MNPASTLVAIVCVVATPACVAGKEPVTLSLDPEQRGFELPARPVLVFYVDGLRADVLDELVQKGELPLLQRYLFDRAARVRSAVACVPSTTYGNAVSMLTGAWPGTHGVWANVSFDRLQLCTRNYEVERASADEDSARESIFELLASELTAGIALPFEPGVKISRAKSFDTGGTAFGLTWLLGREQTADAVLSGELQNIAEQARAIGAWPGLIVVHLPGVDDIGHDRGSDGEDYREAVVNLDRVIGGMLAAFERGGMLEELTVVLTSDHGHHSTPHSFALEEPLAAALGTPALFSAENDNEAPFVERWKRYASARAVVVLNGVREASVYLRAGASWKDRPTLEEILDFPAVLGLPAQASVPQRLLRSPAIELVVARASEEAVRVYAARGSAEIRRTDGAAEEPSFVYEVLAGSDPLGYGENERLRAWVSSAHTSREWLEATADQRYPDLVPQLVAAFDHPRSGDLVLFAARSWDFSAAHYSGGHGGVEREEMIVPLYLAGPGIPPGAELAAARLVDLVPTLLDLVGADVAGPTQFDGVDLMEPLRLAAGRGAKQRADRQTP